jgi:O-antigen ligase
MQIAILWWERGLVTALYLSIALLGVGRLESLQMRGSISAWSISRTTFFFWVFFKLLLFFRGGWTATGLPKLRSLTPLYGFFFVVTVSLLPDFHQAGDYRYFFFGCAHAVMLVDLFTAEPRRERLVWLLGVLPAILVVRGLLHDPLVLNFDLSHRFTFPLDSWNTAGYLFAMSLPLCLFIAVAKPGWSRALGSVSCAAQLLGLVLTFSRGAWLGWGASMLCLGITTRTRKYIVLVVVLALACVLAAPSLRQRALSLSQPQSDQSIRERVQLLKSSVQLGMENPVLGVGYGRGRLKEALRSRLQGTILEDSPIWHTHNLYVELVAGTGLLGLSTFLWLIGHVLLRLWRSAIRRDGSGRLLGFAIGSSLIGGLVAGIGDIPFYHHETRIFFFTLLALAHLYSLDGGAGEKKLAANNAK